MWVVLCFVHMKSFFPLFIFLHSQSAHWNKEDLSSVTLKNKMGPNQNHTPPKLVWQSESCGSDHIYLKSLLKLFDPAQHLPDVWGRLKPSAKSGSSISLYITTAKKQTRIQEEFCQKSLYQGNLLDDVRWKYTAFKCKFIPCLLYSQLDFKWVR